MKLIGRDQVIRCTHCGQRLGPGDAHFCPVTSTEMYFAPDPVHHPPHYTAYPVEVIDIIKHVVTEAYGADAFKAYCLGNEIKYRFRAGLKGDAGEDVEKAEKYREWRGEE